MCYIVAACTCITCLTSYSKNMLSIMWITIYTSLTCIIIKIHFSRTVLSNTTTTSELGFSGITYLKSLWSCCSSFTSLTLSPLIYKNNHTGFIHKDPITHQNYHYNGFKVYLSVYIFFSSFTADNSEGLRLSPF